MLPIEPLRDYFIGQEYLRLQNNQMRKKNFEDCEKFNDFYATVFSKSSSTKKWVINPEIKKLIRRKFDPVVQHDSHEFMVYLLE